MSNSTFNPRSLGALQPFVNNNPTTIVSTRDPITKDRAIIGQLWINASTNASFFLTSIVAGDSIWTANGGGGGGTGVFDSVVITGIGGGTVLDVQMGNVDIQAGDLNIPGGGLNVVGVSNLADISSAGNVSFTGDFDVNVSLDAQISSSSASVTAVTISATDNAGGIAITAKTGGVAINADDGPINITGATGDINIGSDADVKTITIGNNTALTATIIRGGSGNNGITLDADGNTQVTPATSSAASPSSSVTINNRVGVVTFTGFTTAAAGTIVLDITNSKITTQSGILCSVSNLNVSGNNAGMGVESITVDAGSALVTVVNNGAGALGAGDNVLLTFWVIS